MSTYTQVSSLDIVQTAYDRLAYYALRPQLYFDQCADVMPTNQSMPGNVVQFTIFNDLPAATTPLSETVDVTPVSLSDSVVSLTLQSYGTSVVTTGALRAYSFLTVDEVVANALGYNAGLTIDTLGRYALDKGTQVMYASGSGATTLNTAITTRVGVVAGTTIASIDIRAARARLASMNVERFGNLYMGIIHPDIVADLMSESMTNNGGWRSAQIYGNPDAIYNGEVGSYEGVRFLEASRAPIFSGAGVAAAYAAGTYTLNNVANSVNGTASGTYTGATPVPGSAVTAGTAVLTGVWTIGTSGGGAFTIISASGTTLATTGTVTSAAYYTGLDVYATLILGKQALAKTWSKVDGNGPYPMTVPGPIVDRLRRFVPNGWLWYGAYGVFRQQALVRIESSSTLGSDINTTFIPQVDLGETGSGATMA